MTTNTQNILKSKGRAKSVAKYALLPGIIPQIKELFGSGFGYFAFLIAVVFNSVRILPNNHPYLNPNNMGRYSIRAVIAQAANNIKVSRDNWDQITIFIAVLIGILLLVLQFAALIFMAFNSQAFAQTGPAAFAGMFTTTAPEKDIAFLMLDYVFGVPGFFGSDALIGGPTPFHLALQDLFQFYNVAFLVVAALIFAYYVIVVVAETAQTGTPFGRRFSHIYAPLRLVIAIGLLVPLSHGLNGAQYIVLTAAKMGSSFATNGWQQFNATASNPSGVSDANLIATPNSPDIRALMESMSVINACREAYAISTEMKTIEAFVVSSISPTPMAVSGGSYATAKTMSPDGSIKMVFGEHVPGSRSYGYVRSLCGSVIIPAPMDPLTAGGGGTITAAGGYDPSLLQEHFYNIVNFLWNSVTLKFIGERAAVKHNSAIISAGGDPCMVTDPLGLGDDCNISSLPPSNYKDQLLTTVQGIINTRVNNYITQARATAVFTIEQEVLDTGWGGAGIWYNKLSQLNGSYVVAVNNIPHIDKWPSVLEHVLRAKRSENANSIGGDACKMFEPTLADDQQVEFRNQNVDSYYNQVMDEVFQYWRCGETEITGNIFWDTIKAVFGLNGLFEMRSSANQGVHPLAQLSVVGKSLIESAISNLGMAMGASVVGGATNLLGPFATMAQAASGFFVSVATIGLSMGFILFYILPFLPFIYMFFAVGTWVKSIFEAMCAAPMWAIAHLRIDGDGLPGKNAMNGYFLIFEIFLRPILTVFGLLAGFATFSALAYMMNELFDLVVLNITGTDLSAPTADESVYGRHLVDQFFFTIVYAVILYMMATASFKLINLFPQSILRWLGAGVSTFGDSSQDPVQGLTQYAALGGQRIGGQLAGGFTQLGQGVGGLTNIGSMGQAGQGVRG